MSQLAHAFGALGVRCLASKDPTSIELVRRGKLLQSRKWRWVFLMNAIRCFILNQTSEANELISDAPDPTDATFFTRLMRRHCVTTSLLSNVNLSQVPHLTFGSRITGEPVMSCRQLKNIPTVRPSVCVCVSGGTADGMLDTHRNMIQGGRLK